MAKKVVNTDSLVSIADAIRAKTGTTDSLTFPQGFIDSIAAIPSGGGLPSNIIMGTFTPYENTCEMTIEFNRSAAPIFTANWLVEVPADGNTSRNYLHFSSVGFNDNGNLRVAMSYGGYNGVTNNYQPNYGGVTAMDSSKVTFNSRQSNYYFKVGFTYGYLIFFEED